MQPTNSPLVRSSQAAAVSAPAGEWLIWQLADSAFPFGGFAHSSGLEAAWQQGFIPHAAALEAFLEASLVQIERGVLTFAERCWQNPVAFVEADRECDLFLNNHVANRASRLQGRAFLASAAKTFDRPKLDYLSDTARRSNAPCHFPAVFGAVTQVLDISLARMQSLLLFTSMRGVLSAAVRLGIVGPLQAQQIQARRPNRIPPADDVRPSQTAPILDLLQAAHERIYSRLFQS